jgi:hypothetical protein
MGIDLPATTINGYTVSETMNIRGPIKRGYITDLIAVAGNLFESIDALRNVLFVMEDGWCSSGIAS